MTKSYTDFVADLSADSSLAREVGKAFPFKDVSQLRDWFARRGYSINETEARALFENQGELSLDDQPLEY